MGLTFSIMPDIPVCLNCVPTPNKQHTPQQLAPSVNCSQFGIKTAAADKPKAKEEAPNVEGTRRSSVRHSSAAAPGVDNAAAGGPKARRGSGGVAAAGVEGGKAGSPARRGSATRPLSHNSRLSHSSSTQASQQRYRFGLVPRLFCKNIVYTIHACNKRKAASSTNLNE